MKYLTIAVLLAGCMPTEGGLIDRLSSPEKVAERHHNECLSYGFQLETEGYSNCRMALALNRRQAIAQTRAEERAMLASMNEPMESMFTNCTVIAMNNEVTPYYVMCN